MTIFSGIRAQAEHETSAYANKLHEIQQTGSERICIHNVHTRIFLYTPIKFKIKR